MDGYDGDSICELEWDEAERQHIEEGIDEYDESLSYLGDDT